MNLREKITEIAQEQFQMGMRAGMEGIRESLQAGAEQLPEDSPLLPGIQLAIQTIAQIEEDANAHHPHQP